MALKFALLSFEFESLKGLRYDVSEDHELNTLPLPNEGIQPVILKAFKWIKHCLQESISRDFYFSNSCMRNINNHLFIGTAAISGEIQHTDNTSGQTSTTMVARFYRRTPSIRYKVTIDLEELPSSKIGPEKPEAFTYGHMTNESIEHFVMKLNAKFDLQNQIEYMPILRRGRLHLPYYLVSSDLRVMEYDFDKILFHKKSEFQDVKIVSSPSLGNTLLLDSLQNLSEVDLDYTYTLMDRGRVRYKDKEVLILGGGDGGILWELLKESPKFVTMAEIDKVVIDACREHLKPCGKALELLEGPNHQILIEDCMKVLRRSIDEKKKYDVIFNDLTDIPVCKREDTLNAFEASAVQKDNPWHFIETIFNLSLECLADDGLYMTHTTGKGNTGSLKSFEEFLNNSSIAVEYTSRHSYVPSFMEIWVFYTIKKHRANENKQD